MQRIRHRNKRCCQRQFHPNFCHTYCDNIFFHLGRHTDDRQGIGLLQNENFVSTYFHKVWNPLWYISKILILHAFLLPNTNWYKIDSKDEGFMDALLSQALNCSPDPRLSKNIWQPGILSHSFFASCIFVEVILLSGVQ